MQGVKEVTNDRFGEEIDSIELGVNMYQGILFP